MTRIAAVLVTHQSARWIADTLRSVLDQWRQPDVIVIVDDHSTDDTRSIVQSMDASGRLRLLAAASSAVDRSTRIAANFRQALAACTDCDIAVLGDHDDLWHPHRIGHQAGILDVRPDVGMIASDGWLVDEQGERTGGTLRTAFPVPVDFAAVGAAERMRAALRRSVATGGASAVRPAEFAGVEIPDTWLHDRWWSLWATAAERLLVDDEPVIDYRVSADQQVGLSAGHQQRSVAGRIGAGVRELPRTVMRLNDLQRLQAVATEATRPELGGVRLLRNLA